MRRFINWLLDLILQDELYADEEYIWNPEGPQWYEFGDQ